MGLPGWFSGKESVCQCRNTRDAGLIPGSGRFPGVGNGNPLQYYSLEKFHGQRILAGYRPWRRKESDMTEHTHTHTQCTVAKHISLEVKWPEFESRFSHSLAIWTLTYYFTLYPPQFLYLLSSDDNCTYLMGCYKNSMRQFKHRKYTYMSLLCTEYLPPDN